MTKFADLHIHTYFSDGTDSPEAVLKDAEKCNINCIAITDHDTIDGIQPAMDVANKFDVEIITGIELSTELENRDIHMLGYLFRHKDESLVNKLKILQKGRLERVKEILSILKNLGIDNITYEEVCSLTESDAVGRLHIATKLIEKGWVSDIREAFGKYLGDGCVAYVPKIKLSPYEAIETINSLGGVAVMAHPMVTNKDELIPSFVEAGLGGIEVYYSNSSNSVIGHYKGIAAKHNLVATGGSDAHGSIKQNTFIGNRKVPYSVVEELKERAKSQKK